MLHSDEQNYYFANWRPHTILRFSTNSHDTILEKRKSPVTPRFSRSPSPNQRSTRRYDLFPNSKSCRSPYFSLANQRSPSRRRSTNPPPALQSHNHPSKQHNNQSPPILPHPAKPSAQTPSPPRVRRHPPPKTNLPGSSAASPPPHHSHAAIPC